MSAAYGPHGSEYHAPTAYPPTLANHIAHQRIARQALPRRGSESSYLATHDALHSAVPHPYALALSAALASESKQLILPDGLGPVRNKPARARVNLPGPKGQEIPKAIRKNTSSTDLTSGGRSASEEGDSVNLAELKLHPCDFEGCCRVFKRLEHKRRHQRSHTQEKPYQCPVEGCKRFFSRSDNLTQHRRTHERNGRTQRITLANLQHCGAYGMTSGSVPFEQMNRIHAA
ncbi:hypothetical protein P389DRAFT_145911 [Cystobasidium minutum MCA 4210]|uniref:uncharacterized protein n=1 Tax=Cystobasidium minutum MCA 4210 TaxID=1397322 RepID=UPI0034CE49EF|eukprot:jgi/Rhomi1/145911/e_gw1.5.675.1